MSDDRRVPMLDLGPELAELEDELAGVLRQVVRSGRFILGPNVAAFEEEAGAWLGVRHAVGLNSGTDALVIALRSLGVRPGDEVITTPFTFVATAEAIATVGAVPVFADIEPSCFTIDPSEVARLLTPRTRAVVPVHLYGAPAAVDEISALLGRREVAIVEDAAQAFGATSGGRRLGSIGDAGAFSFFPSKPLGGFGDGGLLVTDDDGVAGTARLLRAHGTADKAHVVAVGCNSRLDELQAAVLRVKLGRVDAAAAGRRRAAARYTEGLSGLPDVVPPALTAGAVFHLYTVRVLGGRRNDVLAALDQAGIDAQVRYAVPLHRTAAYGRPELTLPHAEQAAAEVLSLPLWPAIPDAVVDRVVDAMAGALA